MNNHGLIIDNFAGGGGASTGIERALGRPVDYAINHNATALATHKANHPNTHHLCEDGGDGRDTGMNACDYAGSFRRIEQPNKTRRKALPNGMRFTILTRDNFRCAYCGAHGDGVVLVVDHIQPVVRGGTHDEDNLITCCEACNSGKLARQLPESALNRFVFTVEGIPECVYPHNGKVFSAATSNLIKHFGGGEALEALDNKARGVGSQMGLLERLCAFMNLARDQDRYAKPLFYAVHVLTHTTDKELHLIAMHAILHGWTISRARAEYLKEKGKS